jgi:hypothetical protein
VHRLREASAYATSEALRCMRVSCTDLLEIRPERHWRNPRRAVPARYKLLPGVIEMPLVNPSQSPSDRR